MNKGLILVFDLDQTLVATNKQVKRRLTRKRGYYKEIWAPTKKPELNPELLEVLRTALEAKAKGGVYAIFLLTNNSDTVFIHRVIRAIERHLQTKDIFQAILTAEDTEPRDTPKGYTKNYSSKSIRDIYRLLNRMEATEDAEKRYAKEDILKRVIFFDDNPDHQIRRELFLAGVKDQYITISPPFMGINETPYGRVLQKLHTFTPSFFPFQSWVRSVRNIMRKTRKQKRS